MGSPLHPSGNPYNEGAQPVFGSGGHDCLLCAEPKGQQGEQPALSGCSAALVPLFNPLATPEPWGAGCVCSSTSMSIRDHVCLQMCSVYVYVCVHCT